MAKRINKSAAMKVWQQVNFSNRFMFRLVMDDAELCRRVLEVLLGIKILKLAYVEPEKNFETHLRSKGVRLDVYIEDVDGVAYDLEMQAADADGLALGKRTRYYQSMIDQNLLKHGMFYADLPKSLVIFLCKYDPFEKGLLKYTFKNICQEDATAELKDESYKIIINTLGKIEDETKDDLKNFIEFVNTGVARDDLTEKLAVAVDRERKDSRKAVLYMTWQQTLMEEKCKGRAEGKIEGKVENLYSLVKQGLLTLGVAAAQMQMTEQEFLQAGKKLGLSL